MFRCSHAAHAVVVTGRSTSTYNVFNQLMFIFTNISPMFFPLLALTFMLQSLTHFLFPRPQSTSTRLIMAVYHVAVHHVAPTLTSTISTSPMTTTPATLMSSLQLSSIAFVTT